MNVKLSDSKEKSLLWCFQEKELKNHNNNNNRFNNNSLKLKYRQCILSTAQPSTITTQISGPIRMLSGIVRWRINKKKMSLKFRK